MIGLGLYRILTFGIATCENLLLTGVLFGWASLVYIVKQEGYFSHLCPPTNTSSNNPEFLGATGLSTRVPVSQSDFTQAGSTSSPSEGEEGFPTCPEQDAELQLVFTIATFSYEFLLFPMGLVLDKCGTLVMRLFSSFLLITGLLLIAFSSMDTAYLLFPATCFLAVGGLELMFTNLQISNLFGRRKATSMTFLSGCLDSSAFVFIIVKLVYESVGVSLQTSFFILAGICLLTCANTLLLPKAGHIPYPLPPGYRQGKPQDTQAEEVDEGAAGAHEGPGPVEMEIMDGILKETNLKTTEEDILVPSSQSATEAAKSTRYPTLRSCFLSLPALCMLVWFSLLQLNLFFFLGTINPELERLAGNNQDVVSLYTTALAVFQACSIFVSPFCGILLDRNRSKKTMSGAMRGPFDDLLDSRIVFTFTTCLYIVLDATLLFGVIEVRYLSFFLHVVTRSFMYSLAVTGCTLFFPIKYFGSTTGLIEGAASLVGLLQRPLFAIQQNYLDNDSFWIFVGFIGLSLITLILPVYIHVYVKRETTKDESTDL